MSGEETVALKGTTDICPNCGEDVYGHYCPQCGHKHRTPADYSLRNFFLHFFQEFTQLDSKIFRSFGMLLFRPGKLTSAWREGRERSYVKPVQLFLIVNIIYFIFQHVFAVDTIVVSLKSQYSWQAYSPYIQPIINRELKTSHLTFQKFAERYDPISAEQSKTMIFIMVPMCAALVAAVYWRRHRYFVEHLIFSLHLFTFFLLVISFGAMLTEVMVELWMLIWNMHGYVLNWDAWLSLSDAAILFIYLGIALNRVYGRARWLNWIRAGALTYSLLYILWLYRFVLFFTTMAVLKI